MATAVYLRGREDKIRPKQSHLIWTGPPRHRHGGACKIIMGRSFLCFCIQNNSNPQKEIWWISGDLGTWLLLMCWISAQQNHFNNRGWKSNPRACHTLRHAACQPLTRVHTLWQRSLYATCCFSPFFSSFHSTLFHSHMGKPRCGVSMLHCNCLNGLFHIIAFIEAIFLFSAVVSMQTWARSRLWFDWLVEEKEHVLDERTAGGQ